MKTSIILETLKSITGYKAFRKLADGKTWVKLVSIDSNGMYTDIKTLIDCGFNVEIIKDEPLTPNSPKQYITFYIA